jgi:tagaturonate reductase
MQRLSKQWVKQADERLSEVFYVEYQEDLPERVIQFGEGNFLRGFVDWMIHELNKQGLFNGKIAAVQPTPHGKVVPKLNEQDGLYTLVLRGIVNGNVHDEMEVISSISRGINPYEDWKAVLHLAESKDIQFVFSNTTEMGLMYKKEDYTVDQSPMSFPGKLAAFLYHRYKFVEGSEEAGLTIIPCELVEGNADLLKKLVLQVSEDWAFPPEFLDWVKKHNDFCNTLVDRIVTGYPKDRINEYKRKLGYDDILLTEGEPYHLFAIEADEATAKSLPFHKIGLNVHWADVSPFRELKVRILNGAHTMMFAVTYLSGKDTVLDAMNDEKLREFVNKGIFDEILPSLEIDDKQKNAFAGSVIERFLNPFNKHYVEDIGNHSVMKFKTRLLPTLLEWVRCKKELPQAITFSLAALISYYRPLRIEGTYLAGKRGEEEYTIRDRSETIQFFEDIWLAYHGKTEELYRLTQTVLANQDLWGMNLNEVEDLQERVHYYLSCIFEKGMSKAMLESLCLSAHKQPE